MMDWMVIYKTAEGVEGRVELRAATVPNLRAVAWHVIMNAYHQEPPRPLGNLSAEQWLEACAIELVDLVLLRQKSRSSFS